MTATHRSPLAGTKTAVDGRRHAGRLPVRRGLVLDPEPADHRHVHAGCLAVAGSLTATSSSFEVVADLAKCNGASCKNTGAFVSNVPQKTYGTITPDAATFNNNVVLTTQFAGTDSQCTGADNSLVFGQTTEVRVQNTVSGGTGISSTQPDFQVALLYPYADAPGPGHHQPWRPELPGLSRGDLDRCGRCRCAMEGREPGDRRHSCDAVEAGNSNVYWGWVPDCAAVTAYADNPCFELRTKSASQLQSTLGLTKMQFKALDYKSGDLAFVIRSRSRGTASSPLGDPPGPNRSTDRHAGASAPASSCLAVGPRRGGGLDRRLDARDLGQASRSQAAP